MKKWKLQGLSIPGLIGAESIREVLDPQLLAWIQEDPEIMPALPHSLIELKTA